VEWLKATWRVWLPFVVGSLCLFVAGQASSPIVMYVLVIVAIGFLFDALTILWSRGSNLTEHRQ